MMAKRLPSILPPLTLSESLETTQIHSIAGKLGKNVSLISQRPFRAPHHTLSQVALVGGGTNPQPGEISLAHNGVLFCDELPEFNKPRWRYSANHWKTDISLSAAPNILQIIPAHSCL